MLEKISISNITFFIYRKKEKNLLPLNKDIRTVLFLEMTLSSEYYTLRKLSLKYISHKSFAIVSYWKITIGERKVLERHHREYNLLISLFIGKSSDVVMLSVNKLELWF